MQKEPRPKIKIEANTFDFIVEAIGIITLLVLLIVPFYFYSQLPDQIPVHYNFYGQPNAYGGRELIWLMPLIGLALYVLLAIAAHYPHTLNYPVHITSENAYRVYKIGVRSIRLIKVAIITVFSVLNFRTIEIGLRLHVDKYGLVLTVSLLLVAVVLLVLLFQIIKKPINKLWLKKIFF